MRRCTSVAAGLALAMFAFACGGGGDDPVGPPTLCNRAVTVSVAGTFGQPLFTWQPNCLARELIVLGPQDNTGAAPALWWIKSPQGQGFPSGVTYGVQPQGTTTFIGPASGPFAAGSTVNIYDDNGDRRGMALLPTP
jgi:hypothetical protein